MTATDYWYITDALKALTPLVIGLLVFLIAWCQWRTAHAKLKLDLFDRRFTVYMGTRNLIRVVLSAASVDDKAVAAFIRDTKGCEFLFPPEIVEFIDQVLDHAQSLQGVEIGIKKTEATHREDTLAAWGPLQDKHIEWTRGAEKALPETFRKYLDFRKLK